MTATLFRCLRLRPAVLAAAASLLVFTGARASASAAPLTLDDAIRLALSRNPNLKVSAFTPDIARANVLTAYGSFDPAINFQRNYTEDLLPIAPNPLVTQITKTDNYHLSLDGLAPWGLSYSLVATATNQRGTFNANSNDFITFGGISVTQPLLRGFGFGATLANLRLAKADRNIADWQYKQAIIDTVTNTIVAYNNLAQARENLRIATSSYALAAQLRDENEKRNRVGALSDADVIQARARAATRDESILFAERSTIDTENQLREIVGETEFSVTGNHLEIETLPPAPEVTVDLPAELKVAFDQRPDYQAARLGVSKKRINEVLARNQLLPRLDFVGSYGYNGQDRSFSTARAEVRDEDARGYSAGVVVSIPLTFASGRGQERAARLSLRQSESDLVRMESDIKISVTAAAGQLDTTAKRVKATRNAYDLAKQAFEAEEKRFKAGTSRTLDVLQLQEELISAESSWVAALFDQRRAVAAWDRQLGVTLTRHNLKAQ